jgi:stage V sporulation protein G
VLTITEVRVTLASPTCNDNGHIRGYASIVLDGAFCVRDLKILECDRGFLLAMPSRKRCDRCPDCGAKNNLEAAWCQGCGSQLCSGRAVMDESGRMKLYDDVCHPINPDAREYIEAVVMEAYRVELARQAGLAELAARASQAAAAQRAQEVAGIAARVTERSRL